jgi:hypothetical protein
VRDVLTMKVGKRLEELEHDVFRLALAKPSASIDVMQEVREQITPSAKLHEYMSRRER